MKLKILPVYLPLGMTHLRRSGEKVIILFCLGLPMYAMAESNLLTQNLNNNLWNIVVMQDSTSDTYNTICNRSSGYKYSVEAVNGVCGGLLGAVPGGLIVSYGWYTAKTSGDPWNLGAGLCLLFGTGVALVGATLGMPKGVAIAGKKLGDKGSYWKSLLGATLGNVAGLCAGWFALGIIYEHSNFNDLAADIAGISAYSACFISGAVWAYHW
ncbi:MAG: hypothetical protein PHX21_09430 [bacterium]|nr:hypothetical protein [bacterium]